MENTLDFLATDEIEMEQRKLKMKIYQVKEEFIQSKVILK